MAKELGMNVDLTAAIFHNEVKPADGWKCRVGRMGLRARIAAAQGPFG